MTREAAETALFLTAPPMPWKLSLPVAARAQPGPAALGVLRHRRHRARRCCRPWARRMYGGLGLPTTALSADLSVRALRLAARRRAPPLPGGAAAAGRQGAGRRAHGRRRAAPAGPAPARPGFSRRAWPAPPAGPRLLARRPAPRPGRCAGSRTSRRAARAWSGTPRPGRRPSATARSAAMMSRAVSSARRTCRASDSSVCSCAGDRAGRQVVQLHPAARPAEHPLGRVRVERQRLRAAGVVGVQPDAAGLVVDDDQLRAVRPGAGVDPVGPAVEGQHRGLGRHHPLHAERLGVRVQRARRSDSSQPSARR